MPLYEYECTSCHRLTEKIQKYSDPDQTICPHCGDPLERTITAAAISFKGGGWFKDGYSSAKPTAPSGGGDSSAAMVSSDSGSAAAGSAGASSAASGSGSGESAKSGHSAKPEAAPSTSPAPALAATTKA
jgi:putative FmdB family regulatory protein